MIVAVVDDLMFASKIRSAAEHAGRSVVFARKGASVVDAVREAAPSLVIVDLGQPDAAEAIRQLRGAFGATLSIVAFVSHVRVDLVAEGRAAGADRVLARSAFVGELPALVSPVPS